MANKQCTCLDCKYTGKPKTTSKAIDYVICFLLLLAFAPLGIIAFFATMCRKTPLKCSNCDSEQIVWLAKKEPIVKPFIIF